MLTRLMAVRSGGAAYFTKPLDIAEFIDSLDALTTQENAGAISHLDCG
jgi:DNA-binding response OmpR family regulator